MNRSGRAQHVKTYIEKEAGRWVVYLEVVFWEYEGDFPLNPCRHRINDFPTEQRARIAADIYRRTADRDLAAKPLRSAGEPCEIASPVSRKRQRNG